MQEQQTISTRKRVVGALMGAFIGDALALGPHWFYDLAEQHRLYGDWISDYTDPRPDRYHGGMRAGQSSQSGVILELTLRSLVEHGGYDEHDFCQRMDALFQNMDGTAKSGPGGYTSQSIREAWAKRHQGLPWGQVAGLADNTDSAERAVAFAARYAFAVPDLANFVSANTALFQRDGTVVALTTAYAAVLGQLMAGVPLDGDLSNRLMKLVSAGQLPFHGPAPADAAAAPRAGQFTSPEPLFLVSTAANMARDARFAFEPASAVAQVYGMPCAIYFILPAAYYLAARFQGDFEGAVLNAVNGGGQNMARAMLTGALAGAMGGIDAIPQRFVDGLERHAEYLELVHRVAEDATAKSD